jgi:ribosomal protein L29
MANQSELHTQTADQLNALLKEQRAKLAQMRENQILGRLKNTSEIRQIRHQVARILTAMQNVK